MTITIITILTYSIKVYQNITFVLSTQQYPLGTGTNQTAAEGHTVVLTICLAISLFLLWPQNGWRQ